MGDLAIILPELQSKVGNDEAWHDQWSRLANILVSRAAGAVTATSKGDFLLLATLYQIMAEHFVPPSDPRRLEAYATVLDTFEQAQRLQANPTRRLEIPFEGGVLPSYFLSALGSTGPRPTAIFICGLDTTKELWFLRARQNFALRGLNSLFIDTPGIGEALRIHRMPTRYDYEKPVGAAIDYLLTRDDVDPSRIGVVGSSLGGYYVARAAAYEPRIAATIAWGAIWDYHATWLKRLSGNGVSGAPPFQLMYVTGTDSVTAAVSAIRDFKVAPFADRIRGPFLIMHGADDKQVSIDDATMLYQSILSPEKELKVFDGLNGGAAHTQFDNHLPALHFAADWLATRLAGHSGAAS
jgi:dienelactone hydrolase